MQGNDGEGRKRAKTSKNDPTMTKNERNRSRSGEFGSRLSMSLESRPSDGSMVVIALWGGKYLRRHLPERVSYLLLQ